MQTIRGTEARVVLFHVDWGSLGKNRGIWSRKLYRAWHESLNMCSIIIWLQKWLRAAKRAHCGLLCATGYFEGFGSSLSQQTFTLHQNRSILHYSIQFSYIGRCVIHRCGWEIITNAKPQLFPVVLYKHITLIVALVFSPVIVKLCWLLLQKCLSWLLHITPGENRILAMMQHWLIVSFLWILQKSRTPPMPRALAILRLQCDRPCVLQVSVFL